MSKRAIRAFALVGALATAGPPALADDPRPELRVGALPPILELDGRLDDPAWASAPASSELVMVEPRQGERATARTVIKVLAGPRGLVFGVRCEDPDPAGIVSFTKERDGDLDEEDHLILVLDPFRDGRSGYVFAVNPGARVWTRSSSRGAKT